MLDPEADLYGALLFHGRRFRRLRGYRLLRATECVAEIIPGETDDWFGRYLPAQLVLGDPAVRDAAIHAIQACIPHATVLPIGVERVLPGAPPLARASGLCGLAPGPRFVHAQERSREGDTFTYDLEVTAAEGSMLERWEGLQLRIADRVPSGRAWPPLLLGPYLERRVQELIPRSAISIVVEQSMEARRRSQSNRAIQRLLGTDATVGRRPDGKPEVAGGGAVSAAHAGNLTLAVAGPEPVGCDAEFVENRPASVWRDLLGPERFTLAGVLAHEAGDDLAAAATRVWAAQECLKKAGLIADTPLVLGSSTKDGWILFTAGSFSVATLVAPVRGAHDPLALAVLVRSNDARL